jgi:hypothetical protein
MIKVIRNSVPFLISIFLFENIIFPCTVAVISGKGTLDGRPLLWKNRDTDVDESRIMRFSGEKYDFIGIVNANDSEGKEVWAGMNSAGFCLINSASYNLNMELKKKEEEDDSYKRPKDEEGFFMKKALAECANLEEFEKYLDETSGKRGIDANFGVIDAKGGAAFYETGISGYTKFDATDLGYAPEGYILRTNYSFSGEKNEGAGYIRFDRAAELFHKQSATGSINFDWILLIASKDMVNSMTGLDPLREHLPVNSENRKMYHMNDCLARRSAAATILFQGVKPGKDPSLSIMWTRLGHPLCGVVTPVWLDSFKEATLLTGDDSAPMSKLAVLQMMKIFPYDGGNRYQYMDLAPLMNNSGDGFLNKLTKLEKEIIEETKSSLNSENTKIADIISFQKKLNLKIRTVVKQLFPAEALKAGF